MRINLFSMYIYKFLINVDVITAQNHKVWKFRVFDQYTSSHQVLSLLHNMCTMSSHFACKNCTSKFRFDVVKYTRVYVSTEMNAT